MTLPSLYQNFAHVYMYHKTRAWERFDTRRKLTTTVFQAKTTIHNVLFVLLYRSYELF
jgi:hypothetical protein